MLLRRYRAAAALLALLSLTGCAPAGGHPAASASAASASASAAPSSASGSAVDRFRTACRDEIAAQLGIAPARVDGKWGYGVAGDDQGTWTGSAPVVPCYIVVSNSNGYRGAVLKA